MSNLLTCIMYELLPFLEGRKIELVTGFMLVDTHLCQMIQDTPEGETLNHYVNTFKTLNRLLSNFLPLDEGESKVFDISSTNNRLDQLLVKPEYLFKTPGGSGFLQKRLEIYQKYHPEVFELLQAIKQETKKVQVQKAA